MNKLTSFLTGANRVDIRPVASTDLQDFINMFLDPNFIKSFGVSLKERDIENIVKMDIEHWEKHKFGCWSCRDKNNSSFIGRVGLRYVEIDNVMEVGLDYAISPLYWKQGYATEISKLALRFGFEDLKVDSIVCFTLPINIASQKVIKTLGFLYEKPIVYKNRPHVFFRLSKDNWSIRQNS